MGEPTTPQVKPARQSFPCVTTVDVLKSTDTVSPRRRRGLGFSGGASTEMSIWTWSGRIPVVMARKKRMSIIVASLSPPDASHRIFSNVMAPAMTVPPSASVVAVIFSLIDTDAVVSDPRLESVVAKPSSIAVEMSSPVMSASAVGESVGLSVGNGVVGIAVVGDLLGVDVGDTVGTAVGFCVGTSVGASVGDVDGAVLGAAVGPWLGACVGTCVGA